MPKWSLGVATKQQAAAVVKFQLAHYALPVLSQTFRIDVPDNTCALHTRLLSSWLSHNLPSSRGQSWLVALLTPSSEDAWAYYVRTCWAKRSSRENGLILLSLFITDLLVEMLLLKNIHMSACYWLIGFLSVASIVLIGDFWTLRMQATYLTNLTRGFKHYAHRAKSSFEIMRSVGQNAQEALQASIVGAVIFAMANEVLQAALKQLDERGVPQKELLVKVAQAVDEPLKAYLPTEAYLHIFDFLQLLKEMGGVIVQ